MEGILRVIGGDGEAELSVSTSGEDEGEGAYRRVASARQLSAASTAPADTDGLGTLS